MYSVIKPTDLSSHLRFYKFTNEEEVHRGVQYVDGLNVDPLEFSPKGKCRKGGMYFFDQYHLIAHHKYVKRAWWIREVEFCEDSLIYIERNKYKTNKFILKERTKWSDSMIHDYVDTTTEELAWKALRNYAPNFTFLRYRTEEMIEYFVTETHSLVSVPPRYRSRELCEYVVSKRWRMLRIVPPKYLDEKMIMKAVESAKLCILIINQKYHKYITSNVVKKALKVSPLNLKCIKHIENNTYELLEGLTPQVNTGIYVELEDDFIVEVWSAFVKKEYHMSLSKMPERLRSTFLSIRVKNYLSKKNSQK